MTDQIGNYDIYVDGSAIKQVPVASSWGYVCISQNKLVKEDYGVSKKHLESSNIVGEVTAVYEALQWFYSSPRNLSPRIHYDYEGIEKWAVGSWKVKKPISVWYQSVMLKYQRKNEIEFIKVKSHSGDRWNSYVDRKTRKTLMDYLKQNQINFEQLPNQSINQKGETFFD